MLNRTWFRKRTRLTAIRHDVNSVGINDDESRFENYGVSVRISATSTKSSASTNDQDNTSITLMPANWLILAHDRDWVWSGTLKSA